MAQAGPTVGPLAQGAMTMQTTRTARLFLGRYWFALVLVAALIVSALITAVVNAATGGQPLSGQIGYYIYLPLVYNP